MTELVRNPRVMKKAQNSIVMKKAQVEIRSYVGMISYVDESELENLHYLKMMVKETLRLHPPSILSPSREVILGHMLLPEEFKILTPKINGTVVKPLRIKLIWILPSV